MSNAFTGLKRIFVLGFIIFTKSQSMRNNTTLLKGSISYANGFYFFTRNGVCATNWQKFLLAS